MTLAHVIVLGGLLCLTSALASAESFDCPNADATVACLDAQHATIVCAAAVTAMDFMASAGFPPKRTVDILVSDDIDLLCEQPFLSFYDPAGDRVVVPTFETCVEMTADRPVFGVETTEALHRSFIVHEIAHAVAQQHFEMTRPSLVAHEYIAYVAQLATMPMPLRRRVLANYPEFRHVADAEIDELYMSLSPNHFAVKAYRHFTMAENGYDFFGRLLRGDYVPGSASD